MSYHTPFEQQYYGDGHWAPGGEDWDDPHGLPQVPCELPGWYSPKPIAKEAESSPLYPLSRQRVTSADRPIKVNFINIPPLENTYPFRLLDCKHFLKDHEGLLAVQEFYHEDLYARENVDKNRLAWVDRQAKFRGISWVAVSYDSTEVPDTTQDAGVVTFQVAPDNFRIRYDVLATLCMAARDKFDVDYLWLDKLCVRQDSEEEKTMWGMPGNMRLVFGSAKGILVLPNGLCRLPPSVGHCGEPYSVFGPSPDFVFSLRIFLELAFNRHLDGVHLPVITTFGPRIGGVYRVSPEYGEPVPVPVTPVGQLSRQLYAGTILFKDFMEAALTGSFQMSVFEGGSQLLIEGTIPIHTFQLPQENGDLASVSAHDGEMISRQLVRTLLSLLCCRDKLHQQGIYMSQAAADSISEMIGGWEVAIWYNVLHGRRKAQSPDEFILGLAWLLQDLCDVKGDEQQCMCFLQKGSTLEIVTEVTEAVMNGRDARTQWKARLHVPFVQSMLAFLVRKVNKTHRPLSDLLQELLQVDQWKVPLPLDWIGLKPVTTDHPSISSRPWLPCSPQDPDATTYPKMGYLALNIVSSATRPTFLVLKLEGISIGVKARRVLSDSETETSPPDSDIMMGVRQLVPTKIWRGESEDQNPSGLWVQCLELEFNTVLNCWQILRYNSIPQAAVNSPTEKSFSLTPGA